MPNRILRDWTASKKLSSISANAERLFIRLIMKADDYGRFHADPVLIKSLCFPRYEQITISEIESWMNEIRHLVIYYTVNGDRYLEIFEFGQSVRIKKEKFPKPSKDQVDVFVSTYSSNASQMHSTRYADDTQTNSTCSPETKPNQTETKPTVDVFVKRLSEDELWVANTAKSLSRTHDWVLNHLKNLFIPHCISEMKEPAKTVEDFASHFVRWARKRSNNEAPNTTYNDITSMPVNY